MLHPLQTLAALAVLLLLAGACDTSSEQVDFETEALASAPADYTETGADGRTRSVDADDWRLAPQYRGILSVVTPAFPNPAEGRDVAVEVSLDHAEEGVERLVLLAGRWEDGRYRVTRVASTHVGGVPLTYTLRFVPAQLPATGLYRLFVYAEGARGGLVTYGDVEV